MITPYNGESQKYNMAVGGLHTDLTELLSCDICYEDFLEKNPRQLNCLHVFCEVCIQKLVDSRCDGTTDEIACPLCSSKTKVPGRCATELPLFYYSRKIEDVRRKIAERHAVCRVCRADGSRSSVCTYCFQCKTGMCDGCCMKHNKTWPNHVQIKVSPSTINYVMCSDHDVHFEFFCMDCCKTVCSLCCFENHNEHNIHELKYDNGQANRELKALLTSELDKINTALDRLKAVEDETNSNMKRVRTGLKQHRDELLEQLNNQYTLLCGKLDKAQAKIKEDIAASKKQLETTKAHIDKLMKATDRWLEPVRGVPEARIANIEEHMSDIINQIPSVVPVFPAKLKYIPGINVIVLGKIAEQAEEAGAQANPSPKSTEDHKPETIQTSGDDSLEDLAAAPRLAWDICSNSIKDIRFLKSGNLVVIEGHRGLSVFDKGKLKTTHILSPVQELFEGWLRGISENRSGTKIAVTENRGLNKPGVLHMCTSDGTTVTYKRYSIGHGPLFVAFTANDNIMCIGNGTLYKYDNDIEVIWKQNVASDVLDMCVTADDKILISFSSDGLCVYDKNGNNLLSFKSRHTDLQPWGICTDCDGNILVSDQKSKSILLYNTDGDLVRRILNVDTPAHRIALCRKKYLAISTACKVKVYRFEYSSA